MNSNWNHERQWKNRKHELRTNLSELETGFTSLTRNGTKL